MKTLEELNEYIEQSNEKFNNATKAEKRVIVAQDVIDRLKLDQFKVDEGNTIKLSYSLGRSDASIKDYINNHKIINCSACAKGSLFLGYIGRVNEFSFFEIEDDNNTRENISNEMNKLMNLFTANQLDLIECAFELHNIFGKDIKNQNIVNRAVSFGKQYSNPKERLIAICKNIIKNKGIFKP